MARPHVAADSGGPTANNERTSPGGIAGRAVAGHATDRTWPITRLSRSASTAARVTRSYRVAIATDLHEQGVPTDEIRTLLGHRDVRTTNLYKRNRRGVTRNLVERSRLGR